MKGSILSSVLLLLLSTLATAQNKQLSIQFSPMFNNQAVVLDAACPLGLQGDSVSFQALRFYVSAIMLYKDGIKAYEEKNSFHLLDAAAGKMDIICDLPQETGYNTITFKLGIDSATNTSGALAGDLDPAKGMYWAWQSGYINFKLEGKSNVCDTRNNEFAFHMGGYLGANNAIQHISLPVKAGDTVVIQLPLDKFLNKEMLTKHNMIMIPCPDAVELSGKIAASFETVP